MVNGRSYVGETLIKFAPNVKFLHLKRSRGWLSKTVSIAWEILRAYGDLYHVHYALQDAYLISKLKRLDILHVHGSDIRWTINGMWGWMVDIT